MSTNINRGNQSLSFDYKAKAKGQEFNKLLYSIIKPGIYKGITIIPTGLNFVSITPGFVFLNCSYQSETVRGTLARFSTQINSLKIEQTNSGEDEVVYLYFEYKEVVENWVGIYHKPVSASLPAEAIIVGTLSYDGSGNITSVSYSNRQLGLLDEYSISDQNTYSNQIDKTKKSKLDLSKISTGTITSVSLPDYNYALSTIDDWQTARNYNEKEFVVYEGTIYRCVSAHTSTSFFTDLINWESLNNIQDKEIIRGFNNTASGLSQSRVVTIVGDNSTEEIPEIDYISNYNQEPLGIVIQDINSGTSGELQQRGRLVLNGVDLSSGVVGQRVYSDSNGNLTMNITPLEIGQLLLPDVVNPIIYVAILPTEEGLNVIDFNGQLSTLENTIQKAFDRIDDYGYTPVWVSGQTYRVSNVVVRPDDNYSLWTCMIPHTSVSFNSDIINWSPVTDNTAIKYTDRKNIISVDSNISITGGVNATNQDVSIDFSNDPNFNSVTSNLISTLDLQSIGITGNSLHINHIDLMDSLLITSSGSLDNVTISELSFIKFNSASKITGVDASNISQNRLIILSNISTSGTLEVSNDSPNSLLGNRILTGSGSSIQLNKDANILMVYDSNTLAWRVIGGTGSGGGGSLLPINQINHGFILNDYIIYDKNSSSWVLANSPGVYANGSIGYVVEISDVDNFIIKTQNQIITKTGLTPGEFYYVKDDGSGTITVTPPGSQVQAVLFALPNNLAMELAYPSVTPVDSASSGVPKGYNRVVLSFVNDTLSYYGSTEVNGIGVTVNPNSQIITGSLGWRYLCCSSSGVITVETIPVTEIISDIDQYTPAPILDTTKNGYYSSVNSTLRIISTFFFDGTNITEIKQYGSGSNKNDDYYKSTNISPVVTLNGVRFQYTSSFSKTQGTNISIVDNGYGTTDNEGFRITCNKKGRLKANIGFSINAYPISSAYVYVNKNGILFFPELLGSFYSMIISAIYIDEPVEAGDYFTFYSGTLTGVASVYMQNPIIQFEED